MYQRIKTSFSKKSRLGTATDTSHAPTLYNSQNGQESTPDKPQSSRDLPDPRKKLAELTGEV